MPPSRLDLQDGFVDLRTGRIVRAAADDTLTTMELRALCWLVDHAGEEVTHEQLLSHVWEYAPGAQSRAPYFTIRRLRAKLERDPDHPELLHTVHGVGYRFLAPRNPDPPLPRGNVPLQPSPLIGRDELLGWLHQQLDAERQVGLFGPPGVGKTALATRVAAARGGHAWLCAIDPGADPGAAAAAIAAMLRRQPAHGDPIDPVVAVPRMLSDLGPVTLVLDDAAPEAVAELARAWLPRAPELHLVGTHGRRPGGRAAARVKPLRPADGAQLLRQAVARLGRVLADGLEADLQRLSERLDGLPLALELVAPRLLVSTPSRLVAAPDLAANATLDAMVSIACDALGRDAAAVLATLGAFAGSASLADLCAVAGRSEAVTLDALQDLADRCLIKVVDPTPPVEEPRFAVFSSVLAVVRRQPGHDALRARVHGHVAHRGITLRRRADEGLEGVYPELLDEATNLRAAVGHPEAELLARLALDAVLGATGTPEERRANADAAVALAERGPDRMLEVEALLVRAAATQGDHAADLERAASLATHPGHVVRASLGLARHQLQRGTAAIDHLATARDVADASGQPLWMHGVLQAQLAWAVYRGDVEAGRVFAEQVLALRRAHDLERMPQQNLAIWYDLIGDLDTMASVLDADIAEHARRGERAREANAWMNKGYLQLRREDPRAEASLARAVTLARRAGSRTVEATCRYNLCAWLTTAGRLTEANAEGLAALALAESLGNGRLAAMCKLGLGHIACARADGSAVELLEQAVVMADAAGDRATRCFARMLLAPMELEAGDPDRAEAVWAQALADYEAGPGTPRFAVALDVHRALLAWIRGEPAPAEALLAAEAPNGLLKQWIEARPRRLVTADGRPAGG